MRRRGGWHASFALWLGNRQSLTDLTVKEALDGFRADVPSFENALSW